MPAAERPEFDRYSLVCVRGGRGEEETRSCKLVLGLVECCFTSDETAIGLLGTGAQDGHLDFHTAPELCSLKLLYDHSKPYGLLGTGAQDVHLDFHTAPEVCGEFEFKYCFTSIETIRTIRDGEP